ncbi:MAG: hypothetical protein JJT94_00860 [Bernardetiaceae bacterium]|nr:hypothetical protein [Bernardetiaceae bacterium]
MDNTAPILFTIFGNSTNDLEFFKHHKRSLEDIFSLLESHQNIQCVNITGFNFEKHIDLLDSYQNCISILHFYGTAHEENIKLGDTDITFEHIVTAFLNRNKHSLSLVFLNGCAT